MKKRAVSLMLAVFVLLSFTACKETEKKSSASFSSEVASDVIEEPKYVINPLTGKEDLKKSLKNQKPVAIMINNISTAWGVQSSLSKADVIYETYVEGGITRLLAVFKDLKSVGKNYIGSLRSARYSYVDLAAGMNAQFVHAGLDETYCGPHIEEAGVTTVDLNTTADSGSRKGGNNCAFRWENGLSYEHTLFTKGNDLYSELKKLVGLKGYKARNFMNFQPETETVTPSGGTCKELYVPFVTTDATFKYDAESGLYKKYRSGEEHKDAANNKILKFRNVLVLYTSVTTFPDGKHMLESLDSGDGYYVSNGAYQKIKWSKGAPSDPFKFTDKDGNELKANAGKTYVCINSLSDKSGTKITK